MKWPAIKIRDDVFVAACHADALKYALDVLTRSPADYDKLVDDIDNNRIEWLFGFAERTERPTSMSVTGRGKDFMPTGLNENRIERYVKPAIASYNLKPPRL